MDLLERERYRLIQDGMPVAWSEGPLAINEINHYALVYGQDGPVKIERHSSGKWRPWPPKRARSAMVGDKG
jgi:hypothetical protein